MKEAVDMKLVKLLPGTKNMAKYFCWLIFLLPTLPAYAQLLDDSANREHIFPLFVDGDGFRSYLVLTNVSDPGNQCTLELHGAGLDADRFDANTALTTTDAGAAIELAETGSLLVLATAGEQTLTIGYAKLDCTKTVVARMLLTRESAGLPITMTTMESAQPGNSFQFPVLPRLGRLGLVFSNGNNLDADCAVELEDVEGTSAGGGNIAVPAESAVLQFLDDVIPVQAGFAGGSARVSCSRDVAALGVPLSGSVFTALEAVDLENNRESNLHHVLPLVLDGEGFQSNLIVTNLSEAANQCAMNLPSEVTTARFESTEGMTKNGFRRATLELAGHGDQISILSLGRHSLAYGYITLDCDEPVSARNLLTVGSQDGLAGMASISPVRPAEEIQFPVIPPLGRLALVLTNDSESDTSCVVTLESVGPEERISTRTSVQVADESTAVRFLADLFDVSDNFSGGTARIHCDKNIAAFSLPYSGTAFAATPPVILAFDTSPVFEEETSIEDQAYTEGTNIEAMQLPRASGGNGELTYSLMPEVPGLIFDSATLQLAGTPTQAGVYEMTYTATDANDDPVSLSFTIAIASKPDPVTRGGGGSGGSGGGGGGVGGGIGGGGGSGTLREPLGQPDLEVSGPPSVSDSSPLPGGSFTLSATVSNDGDGESAATTLRYYRSADATITTSDTAVGTDGVSALPASGSSAESISLTAPATAGAYYYGACVDAVTDESDTTNNCSSSVEVIVLVAQQQGNPDMAVGSLSVSDSSPLPGGSFTLSATVSNDGDGESAATTLRYYRSADATITTSDTAVGTDGVSALPASGSSAESISLTAPATAGAYYYGACVDAVTDESDTTNNCSASLKVEVEVDQPPDLVVLGPNLGELQADGTRSLSVTVQNQGGRGPTMIIVRYYLSTDETITTSDTGVAIQVVTSVFPVNNHAGTATVRAPTTPGTYYYGACVDAVSGESDTTNNCSTSVSLVVN